MSPTSHRSAVKLVIGPDNTAGQAFRWAESCRTYEGVESVSFAGSRRRARRIDGPSHRRALHYRVRPTLLKTTWARLLLRNATHFLNESFSTITGDRRTESLNRDLPWLRDVGISVGVLFHGSDIRSPSRHMDSQPSSYFRIMEPQMVSSLEESTSRNRQLARESGLPLFVSTPDLLLDLPEATWLPVAADLLAWHSTTAAFVARPLRVLHVPSRRIPPIKGTSFIDPVLARLAAEGLVEYVSPEGTPHEQMPELVRSVDVVIDQVLSGSYGVAAVEAMAAARLVIGNLGLDVRAAVDRPIPIVDCAPAELEGLVRDIAADPVRFASTAEEGPAFVESFHSGARSARSLVRWLDGARG